MNSISPEEQATIRTLFEQGWGVRAIARRTGVHRNTVTNRLKRWGLQARPPGFQLGAVTECRTCGWAFPMAPSQRVYCGPVCAGENPEEDAMPTTADRRRAVHADILRLRRAGWQSSLNIAKSLAVGQKYVELVCKNAGLAFAARQPLTADQQDRVVRLYTSGVSLTQVCHQLKVPEHHVKAVLDARGLKKKRRLLSLEEKGGIVEMYEAGATYDEIRIKWGVSNRTIVKVARDAGCVERYTGQKRGGRWADKDKAGAPQ